MPEGFFAPLPEGITSSLPVRSGKFYDIEVYGDIYAEGGAISGDLAVSGDLNITGNTTIAGTLDITNLVTIGDDMVSDDWNGTVPLSLPDAAATLGWAMDGAAGIAQFQNIYAEGGELVDLDVSGTLDMVTGGVFRTAASGRRLELSKADFGDFKYYSGQGSELSPAAVSIDSAGSMRVKGVVTASGNGALTFLLSGDTQLTTTTNGDVEITSNGSGDVVLTSGPTGTVKTSSDIELTTDDLLFSFSGDQYVSKSGSGDLILRNLVTSGDIAFYADDSGGTNRQRYRINGNGVHQFYGDNGGSLWNMDLPATSQFHLHPGTSTSTRLEYDGTAQRWQFYIGSVELMRLNSSGGTSGGIVRFPEVYTDSVAGSANIAVYSDGRIRRVTSALKYKKNVSDASQLEDVRLKPVSYQSKAEGTWHYGFIADWLANQDRQLGVYEDEVIEDYDTRAVLAVLAAKVNRLERKLARCNCAV